MNSLGLEATSVGNHEFDEGYKEVQRLASGGCLPDGDGKDNQDSCPGASSFTGADFQILAANVKYAGTDQTILPPYWIKTFPRREGRLHRDDAQGDPDHRQPGRGRKVWSSPTRSLPPMPGASAADTGRQRDRRAGAPGRDAVRSATFTGEHVSATGLEHRYDWACDQSGQGQGLDGRQPDPPDRREPRPADRHGDLRAHPPAVRLRHPRPGRQQPAGHQCLVVRPAVHRDRSANTTPRRGTSCARRSRAPTRSSPGRSRRTPTENALIAIATSSSSRRSRTRSSARSARRRSRAARSTASLRSVTSSPTRSGPTRAWSRARKVPQIAFMNPGGIRADLITTDPTAPYDVTYEQAFTVQPFNNYVVSMDMTGHDQGRCSTSSGAGQNSGAQGRSSCEVSRGLPLRVLRRRRSTGARGGDLQRATARRRHGLPRGGQQLPVRRW